MKKIFLVAILFFSYGMLKAQGSAEDLATKIARRMKDSLQLTDSQRAQIFQINIQLTGEKAAARTAYAGTDSLRAKIQEVENRRDGLYSAVLTTEQFVLYRQKKRNLINNN